MDVEIIMPACAGIIILAEWTGLAYVAQAAESLARDSLRVPP
jgi:hypothetical protein